MNEKQDNIKQTFDRVIATMAATVAGYSPEERSLIVRGAVTTAFKATADGGQLRVLCDGFSRLVEERLAGNAKSLWIARDAAVVPDSARDLCDEYPEQRRLRTRLAVYYDKPQWDAYRKAWTCAREMAEIPNYMYPEIAERQCRRFVDAGDDTQ